jgi:hypothetical protein
MRDAMLQMIPTTITITGKTTSWSCSSNAVHQTQDDFASLLYTTNAGGCGAVSSSPSQILWHLALQNVNSFQKSLQPTFGENFKSQRTWPLSSNFCKSFYLFIVIFLFFYFFQYALHIYDLYGKVNDLKVWLLELSVK